MRSEEDEVREMAVKCIGLYCLLDRSGAQAKRHLPILLSTLRHDVDDVRIVKQRQGHIVMHEFTHK